MRVHTAPWDTPTAILHSFLLLSWVSSLRHALGKWGRCLWDMGCGQRHGHAAFDQENVRCNFGTWLVETWGFTVLESFSLANVNFEVSVVEIFNSEVFTAEIVRFAIFIAETFNFEI